MGDLPGNLSYRQVVPDGQQVLGTVVPGTVDVTAPKQRPWEAELHVYGTEPVHVRLRLPGAVPFTLRDRERG